MAAAIKIFKQRRFNICVKCIYDFAVIDMHASNFYNITAVYSFLKYNKIAKPPDGV